MKVWKYSLEVLGPKREGKYVNVEGRLYFPKRGVVGYEMLGDGALKSLRFFSDSPEKISEAEDYVSGIKKACLFKDKPPVKFDMPDDIANRVLNFGRATNESGIIFANSTKSLVAMIKEQEGKRETGVLNS